MAAFSWGDPHFSVAPPLVAGLILAWYFEAIRRCSPPVRRRQKVAFVFGTAALAIAGSWPLSELARTTSLAALVVQREVLFLVAAPLMLFGIPVEIGISLTRPAPIDWIVSRLSKPAPALVTTTVLFGITAMPFTVSASSRNSWVSFLVAAAVLVAGFVMWNPVIRRVPGVHQLTLFAMAGYLFAQSLAPTYLSFTWIFAPHPLYPSLHGQRAVLGISALFDQQISGYVAKLVTFGVLWPVAFLRFSQGMDNSPEEPTLHWMDVERQLERVHRQERKGERPELTQPSP